jgi:nucleotide-binding universal stress UspA family protein
LAALVLHAAGRCPLPTLAWTFDADPAGIEARLHQEEARGRPIGEALAGVATDRGLDLLVMGAFGHSRFREFVLGGATRSMLQSPPCPVLLAH